MITFLAIKCIKIGRLTGIYRDTFHVVSQVLIFTSVVVSIDVNDWINSLNKNDFVSISVTRSDNTIGLRKWISNKKIIKGKNFIIWNVIGPEGGWSKNEIEKFLNLKMQFIKLSENILRTSTAAINTASVLAECREELMRSIYYS